MPLPIAKVRWRCPQCHKSRWYKPVDVKTRHYCSRACQYAASRAPEPVRIQPSVKRTYGERECGVCGRLFTAKSALQKYCSHECSVRNFQKRRRRSDLVARPCEYCGKEFRPKQGTAAGRFCSRACYHAGARGDKAPHWRGGKHVSAEGYVKVQAVGHPAAHGAGDYVSEHRLVMEAKIGRYLLPGENVHHINGIKTDNRPENLELWVSHQPRGWRFSDAKHCPTCTCEANAIA